MSLEYCTICEAVIELSNRHLVLTGKNRRGRRFLIDGERTHIILGPGKQRDRKLATVGKAIDPDATWVFPAVPQAEIAEENEVQDRDAVEETQ